MAFVTTVIADAISGLIITQVRGCNGDASSAGSTSPGDERIERKTREEERTRWIADIFLSPTQVKGSSIICHLLGLKVSEQRRVRATDRLPVGKIADYKQRPGRDIFCRAKTGGRRYSPRRGAAWRRNESRGIYRRDFSAKRKPRPLYAARNNKAGSTNGIGR